jgi:hypothetical protein
MHTMEDIHNMPLERYLWILELLNHCSIFLPNLQSMNMQDPPGNIGFYEWLKTTWCPPADMEKLCHKQGILLDVQISYPSPLSETET